MGRIAGWTVAGLGLAALGLSGMWLARPDEAASGDDPGFGFVLPVVLTTIERGDVHPHALLSGTVRAARRARSWKKRTNGLS